MIPGPEKINAPLLFRIFTVSVLLAYLLGFITILTGTIVSPIVLILFASLITAFIIIDNRSWRIRKLYWAGFALLSISPVLVHFIGIHSGTDRLWFGYLPLSFLIVLGILQQVFLRTNGKYPVFEKPVETKEDGLYALLLLLGGLLLAHKIFRCIYS